MAKSFLDTNIFFYAIDSRDLVKQRKARDLIAKLAANGEGVVSTQVVQELANNAMKKLGFSVEETTILCEAFADHFVVKPDLTLAINALALMKVSSVSFWEACILAAAELAHCKILYTEDLCAGQRYGNLQVVNPFS